MDYRAKMMNYAALKAQIAHLEEELETLQPEIVEIVSRLNPTDRTVVVDGHGTFTVATRKTYAYPDDIVAADEALKARKKDAVRLGAASAKETEYLLYKPIGAGADA